MATGSSPRSCRSPEAQRRFSVHGSTNVNYRSLEDDNDFELNISVDDEGPGVPAEDRRRIFESG